MYMYLYESEMEDAMPRFSRMNWILLFFRGSYIYTDKEIW